MIKAIITITKYNIMKLPFPSSFSLSSSVPNNIAHIRKNKAPQKNKKTKNDSN